MRRRVSRRQRGFTMVEILVVIAILGLLASILVPSMRRMKASALSMQCLGKLRNLGMALNDYFIDHGTIYPVMVGSRESKEDDEPALDTVLIEYVRDEYAFECPADHRFFKETGTSYFWNSLINGQRMGNMNLLGLTDNAAGIPLMSDKENFHQNVGDGVNILYADGHVLKELQFIVE